MSPIMLIGTGILLFVLGLGCGYWFLRSQRQLEAARANNVQKELDEYRRHVTEHFGKTAQHFQALGQQYQSLYKHMAQGADALCDPAQAGALLEFPTVDAAAISASSEPAEETSEIVEGHAITEESEPERIIRDYAVADEDLGPDVASEDFVDTEEDRSRPAHEAKEEAATSASVSDPAPSDIEVDDTAVDEKLAEQVATPPDAEKERTVH